MTTTIMHHTGNNAKISEVRSTPDNSNALTFCAEGDRGGMLITIFNLPKEVTDILVPALEKAERVATTDSREE